MADLTFLNDAAVLHNLRQRYYCKLIYVSNYGSILINLYVLLGKTIQEGNSRTSKSTKIRKS